MAMPVSQLLERVKAVVLKHAAEGKIFRTKQNSHDPDKAIRVNTKEPIWIWKRVLRVLDTPGLVYFPTLKAASEQGHQGLTKQAVIQNTRLCGWSAGLIEPILVMPQPGKAKTPGKRKQLEAYIPVLMIIYKP